MTARESRPATNEAAAIPTATKIDSSMPFPRVEAWPSVSGKGWCNRPSHARPAERCPIHGCAPCCVDEFVEIASWMGTDEPPLGPPDVPYQDQLPPEWYHVGERWDAVTLWEGHVTDEECRICREIVWRAIDPLERAAIEAEESNLGFCETCFVTQRTARICTRCHQCEKHADGAGLCEDVAERWSQVRQKFVPIYFDDHSWCGGVG